MNQRELLEYVVAAFERLSIPHMVVGSFASYAYGEPRFTQGIDIVLDLHFGTVPAFCAAFPARGAIAAWAEKLGYTAVWNTVLKKLDG